MPRRVYRRYNPRLKNLVANSKDISHFYKLGIPKSTLKQWEIFVLYQGVVDFRKWTSGLAYSRSRQNSPTCLVAV